MGSLALLVDHRGSRLELGANDTLVVQRPDGHCERVGLKALGEVVLVGDVQLDSRVLRALARENVALSCLPLRGADGAALLLGAPNRAAMVRHAQHRCYADDGLRLALARITIRHKIGAAETLAVMPEPGWAAAIESAVDLASLMGVEGAASRRHFERIRSRLPEDLGFCQRQRRPPRDPVNALLSLCYTLIQAPAAQMLVRAGLDPQLGFLHEAHRDRPALALDLIEAARPHLDEFVVQQFANGTLDKGHFHPSEGGGMRLNLEGRRRFFPRWFTEGEACARRPMKVLLAEWLGLLLAAGSVPPPVACAGNPAQHAETDRADKMNTHGGGSISSENSTYGC